jgi:hypothetical protein
MNEQVFTGIVSVLSEVQSFTSKKDGSVYVKQELILEETNVEHPKRILLEAFGEDKVKLLSGVKVGEMLTIYYTSKANHYMSTAVPASFATATSPAIEAKPSRVMFNASNSLWRVSRSGVSAPTPIVSAPAVTYPGAVAPPQEVYQTPPSISAPVGDQNAEGGLPF